MIEFEVKVDGEFIYNLRADGLIVATPTGSTAYALSAGGPILHPSLSAIALVPVSPHTLSNRPIAMQRPCEVEITLMRGADARAISTVQAQSSSRGRLRARAPRAARGEARCIPTGYSYYAMLREKLHWNESRAVARRNVLRALSIRDFVIVDRLDLEFAPASPCSPARPARASRS